MGRTGVTLSVKEGLKGKTQGGPQRGLQVGLKGRLQRAFIGGGEGIPCSGSLKQNSEDIC